MRKTRNDRRVDGFLLLDKPRGITSNAALQHVKRLYRAQRAGHTGTLDPLASGLLPLCLGEATKFAGELLHADKAYRAEVRLGVRTSTADAEGVVLETRPVNVSEAQVAAALERFRGAVLQVPPMFSALKRAGVPLYVHAREGRTLEREARPVHISSLILRSMGADRLEIDVACSKGTYIRVLAEDLGSALGCGAHLAGLVRTRIGPFSLEQSTRFETLESSSEPERDRLLMPVDALLESWPPVALDPAAAGRFGHGQAVAVPDAVPPGPCRVYAQGGCFLGTAVADESGSLQPKRLVSPGSATAPPG